jgi:hypothetical protein
MKLFHGGETFTKHSGLCLTDLEVAARHYGEPVKEVEVDLTGLNVLTLVVSDEDIEAAEYPGDRADQREAYLAAGVDVLDYNDATQHGREHRTLRFLSAAALDRIQ